MSGDSHNFIENTRITEGLSQGYLDRFSGIGRAYGSRAMTRLSQAHACVVGIGGVGTWVAEALARSGIGQITLIDLDEICVTNINRQLHALTSTVGQSKVGVMASRLLEINPELRVFAQECFYTEKTEEMLLGTVERPSPFDVVVDAIDQTERKAKLIEACFQREIPVVTCGAAGGRRAPHLITTDDLKRSTHDGLLRRVKQILNRSTRFQELILQRVADSHQGSPKGESSSWGVPAVFSTERAVYPTLDGEVCHTSPSREALRLGCESGFGSLTFVTGTFGFVASSVAIDLILSQG